MLLVSVIATAGCESPAASAAIFLMRKVDSANE
ncbi:MAG: Uncharacterised protein [SAR116 cluster bacterium]|nr:MAG: Uncharacterised protein [SAR116 cluster bacterium]